MAPAISRGWAADSGAAAHVFVGELADSLVVDGAPAAGRRRSRADQGWARRSRRAADRAGGRADRAVPRSAFGGALGRREGRPSGREAAQGCERGIHAVPQGATAGRCRPGGDRRLLLAAGAPRGRSLRRSARIGASASCRRGVDGRGRPGGGLDEKEKTALGEAVRVSVGPHVLRAETPVAVAAALVARASVGASVACDNSRDPLTTYRGASVRHDFHAPCC